MIPLNKPYLPSFEKYSKYLATIYENVWLTNNGPLLKELKGRLEEYLGVKHLLLTTNGTMALQIAYKALNLKGNVVSTPYSFIATSASVEWLDLNINFADVNPQTLNLCAQNTRQAIDENTTAIVPVHVYGNPCDVKAFEKVAQDHNVKIIYDAAHAFGVKIDGKSILNYGDASILSFHATKLFHAVEGGGIVFKNEDDYQHAVRMINFGIDTQSGEITKPGTNGRMSELHAAMGLAMLDDIDIIMERRVHHFDFYHSLLGNNVTFPLWHDLANQNAAYLPVIFDTEQQCSRVFAALEQNKIQSRRYFSPSLNTLEHLHAGKPASCPVAERFAKTTLCLPLFVGLSDEDIKKVCTVLIEAL
ncbi:MAG: dTDP-4-amino-4,6-dideoxygalactose transaminase [Paraglaciecola sp.]|jgi:dTDP-4-amino-4,6-dideoxygalactose transaminase